MPDSPNPRCDGLVDLKRQRANYFFHVAEGGCYMGGSQFVSPNCVLPRVVELLGGPAWIIGLAPALTMLGFNTLPVITAHRVERLQRVMPLVVVAGVFQRAPFLVAGLLLLLAANWAPWLPLVAVLSAPLLSGIVGGLISTAWQELVAKTVPNEKRSSLFAWRYTISSIIGISAGGVIAWVLARVPGVAGYGVLYLIGAGFLTASFLFFIQIREPVHERRGEGKHVSLMENIGEMLAILRGDGRLRRYVAVTFLTGGTLIMSPFLPIHVLRATGSTDSFLGALVTAQMVGAIAGNFASGWGGDRYGGKVIMMAGRLLMALSCLAAGFLDQSWAFAVLFFVQGAAGSAIMVGAQTMNIELCPYEKRSTYLAVMAIVNMPAMLLFSFLGARLWDLKAGFTTLSVAATISIVASMAVLAGIAEPRKAGAQAR